MQQNDCPHADENQPYSGWYVGDELKKAVILGYRVKKVFEIWQYETIQYNPVTGAPGLFEEYIRTFLKFKQEASGYPADCIHDGSKDRCRISCKGRCTAR